MVLSSEGTNVDPVGPQVDSTENEREPYPE